MDLNKEDELYYSKVLSDLIFVLKRNDIGVGNESEGYFNPELALRAFASAYVSLLYGDPQFRGKHVQGMVAESAKLMMAAAFNESDFMADVLPKIAKRFGPASILTSEDELNGDLLKEHTKPDRDVD